VLICKIDRRSKKYNVNDAIGYKNDDAYDALTIFTTEFYAS